MPKYMQSFKKCKMMCFIPELVEIFETLSAVILTALQAEDKKEIVVIIRLK